MTWVSVLYFWTNKLTELGWNGNQ